MKATTREAKGPDGRSTRWESHRVIRRAELLQSSIAAIRAQGPNLGMDEFAAAAGTSKTVLYRHFTDRAGLHQAVAEAIEAMIAESVGQALLLGDARPTPRSVVAAAVRAYVALVESEPNLYDFLFRAPLLESPAGRPDLAQAKVTLDLAGQVRVLLDQNATTTYPNGTTQLWAEALLGLVRTGVDVWKRGDRALSAEQVTELLTELAWHGASTAFHTKGPGPV
ncbi:TetR/AcrR family transcriptional regulator [Nostocoides australiense]